MEIDRQTADGHLISKFGNLKSGNSKILNIFSIHKMSNVENSSSDLKWQATRTHSII